MRPVKYARWGSNPQADDSESPRYSGSRHSRIKPKAGNDPASSPLPRECSARLSYFGVMDTERIELSSRCLQGTVACPWNMRAQVYCMASVRIELTPPGSKPSVLAVRQKRRRSIGGRSTAELHGATSAVAGFEPATSPLNAPRRSRTCNLPLKRRILCQLS